MAYFEVSIPPGVYANGEGCNLRGSKYSSRMTKRKNPNDLLNQLPFEVRFWNKVSRKGIDDCWLWIGAKVNGYGHLTAGKSRGGKNILAHRASFEMANGPIPDGMVICHKCDVRACVNPGHLFCGTQADNMLDCKAKGRARGPNYRGSKVGTSKLVESEVVEIKRAIAAGARNCDLGRKYGVCNEAIGLIKNGTNWRHIEV